MNNTPSTNLRELLAFYEQIPADQWGVGHSALKSSEAPCAIGHWARSAGYSFEGEYAADAIYDAFEKQFGLFQFWRVNDGDYTPNAKARVIEFLKELVAQ